MVKVYSKPACTPCKATYATLDRKGIEYQSIDVTEDLDAFDHIRSLGYMQTPVVVTENGHWSGFRPDRIEEIEQ